MRKGVLFAISSKKQEIHYLVSIKKLELVFKYVNVNESILRVGWLYSCML